MKKFIKVLVLFILSLFLISTFGCFASDGETSTAGISDDNDYVVVNNSNGEILLTTRKLSLETTEKSVDGFLNKVNSNENIKVLNSNVEGVDKTYARLILQVENSKVESVMASLKDGVIVVDESKREINMTTEINTNKEKKERLEKNIEYLEDVISDDTNSVQDIILAMQALDEFKRELSTISSVEKYQGEGSYTKIIVEIVKTEKTNNTLSIIIICLFGVVIVGALVLNGYKSFKRRKAINNKDDNQNNDNQNPPDNTENHDFI